MILGQAIGRLVSRLGGQLLLELPDDLPVEFVARLVDAVNGTHDGIQPLCLFVRDRRPDVAEIAGSVSLRDWGGYRYGNRLAVVYASDNRGMATFNSVYPLLFAQGFPGDGSRESVGVASLDDLVDDIPEALDPDHTLGTHGAGELRNAIKDVARYLASAYSECGNGQSSFATDWWLHVDAWLNSLSVEARRDDARDLVYLAYGAAGLPRPSARSNGLELQPRQYVKILRERWTDAQAILRELERLTLLDGARGAAEELLKLDWAGEVAELALRTDSPPSLVGLVGLLTSSGPDKAIARVSGWSTLSEEFFAHSFEYAKGKLVIGIGCQQLPRPWPGASGVLVCTPEMEQPDASVRVDVFSLTIPWKSGAPVASGVDLEVALRDVRVGAGAGEVVDFQAHAATRKTEGLCVDGTAVLKPSRRSPNSVRLLVEVAGETAKCVVDKSDASLSLVKSDQAAMLVRKLGGRGRNQARGPVIWTAGNGTTQLRLESGGKIQVAIAAGEQAGILPGPLRVGVLEVEQSWEGLSREDLALAEIEIQDSVRVAAGSLEPFELSLDSDLREAPIAPVRAAAQGVSPRLQEPLDPTDHRFPNVLGILEIEFGKILSGIEADECALGAVLVPSTDIRSSLEHVGPGVVVDHELSSRLTEVLPVPPTSALTSRDSYRLLADAYKALRIPEHIEALEREQGTECLTISRISLDFLSAEQVSRVLNAYQALLCDLEGLAPSDMFWARHPFSVAIYPCTQGELTIQAVLLSPLHPIRLGWMWKVQASLRAVQEDEGETIALQALSLLDASVFPSMCHAEDGFGQAIHFVPVPIDGEPEDLYLGWHAAVSLVGGHFAIPDRLMGFRFPVQGHSGLSAGSVVAAIDDFMRVSPEVQAIRVSLAANAKLLRSTSIDTGIAEQLASLAEASSALEGVMGVTILDSTNRIGAPPSLSRLSESLIHGRPGFHFEWKSVSPEDRGYSHITFLEGLAATAAVVPSEAPPSGWLPDVPLRRFPHRDGRGNVATLGYALTAAPQDDMGLWTALREYESPDSRRCELHVRPNLGGLPTGPNWMVASDFGVDPQAISATSARVAGAKYLLWDWRPVPTIKVDRSLGSGSRPYFIVAAIPEALTTAIRERIAKLRSGLDQQALTERVRALVQKLSSRAIGLNTLIAIGHHQATGALGFYFALSSLERWVKTAQNGVLRMLVPVDAVDGFLSDLVEGGSRRHRRADLLAVQVDVVETHLHMTLVPVEVKHYGLSTQEEEVRFPISGDPQLAEHVEQLSEYQATLESLCDTYMKAVGGHASVLGQQLATVLEAAIQLNPPGPSRKAAGILQALVEGKAELSVGRGVLLWYQPRGATESGDRLAVETIDEEPGAGRVEVRVDPAAFDAEFWGDQEGPPHEAVSSAMMAALDLDAPRYGHSISQSGESPGATHQKNAQVPAAADGGVPHETGEQSIDLVEAVTPKEARPRMEHARLAGIYRRLLSVLAEFKVSVEVPEDEAERFREGPAFLQFAVDPSYGVPVSRIEGQLENLKLRLGLEAEQSIGASTHHGHVILTVPKADRDRYFISTSDLWAKWSASSGRFQIPLGEDIGGNVVAVDLASSNSPHLLIAGVTGSGKSEALLTLLRGAAHFYPATELRFFLVDPKRVELSALENDPHTAGEIGYSAEDAIRALSSSVDAMEQRYEVFRQAGVRDITAYQEKYGAPSMPRWLVVLDEYADLVTDDGERKEIEKLLKRLSQKARAAGIHLIVSTQKPVKEVINTVVKGNLPGRIALRVNSNGESRVILDEGGAEQLVGKGDALLKVGNQVTRLQFAKYND